MSENVEASTSRKPKDFHGLYRDNFTFTLFIIIRIQLKFVGGGVYVTLETS
jgi:hypothetical protein